MAFTETWLGYAGTAGTAGWNLYGTNGYIQPIYSAVGWTSTQDGLQAVLGSGRPYEARMYTWHGMTAQGTGPFSFAYRAAADGGSDTWLETAYMIGVSGDGSSWLYIIDGIQAGTSRTYGWAYATQQFGSLSVRFGTTVSAGDWGLTGLTMNVTYGGSGTWHGTWTGTKTVAKAGTYVTLTATLTPGSSGTWFFRNNISAVLLYSDSDSDVTWQNASFTLPYTNTEENVRFQRLAYVGTWNDGSSVGYLPLGSLLASCSDINYFAAMPFEHRAWCPSVTMTLNDAYNSSTSQWLIQHGILSGGTGVSPHGSLVLYGSLAPGKTAYPWRCSRMFAGYITENPKYDYIYRTCEFKAEGGLAAYTDRTFDLTKAPWVSRDCGTWGALSGRGTYCLRNLSRFPAPYTRLYPTGSAGDYLTVQSIVQTGYTSGSAGHITFTAFEAAPPPGFRIGAPISAIDAWPTPEASIELRGNPRLLVENLLANLGLTMSAADYTGTDYTGSAWVSWADQGVLTTLPPIRPDDKVIDVLNEVCVALGCFYTVTPMGGVAFHPAFGDMPTILPYSANDSYSAPSQFACEILMPRSGVDVSYGFEALTGDGPNSSLSIEQGSAGPRAALAARFLGDPIAALVAGYRALREYESPLSRIAMSNSTGRLSTWGVADPARVVGYLGRAASMTAWQINPGFGWGTYLTGAMVSATYHVADDWLEFVIQQTPAVHPWVCWGSSVPYNGTARWF